MAQRRYGIGQGNPEGWTWAEILDPPPMTIKGHLAACCHDELVAEIVRLRGGLETIAEDTEDTEGPYRSLGASGPVKCIARAALDH